MRTLSSLENQKQQEAFKRVFITGVSRGLGLALACLYLDKGWTVYGTARHKPTQLAGHDRFIFKSCDLQDPEQVAALFEQEFSPVITLGVSVIHLNAGVSSNAPLHTDEYDLSQLQKAMMINVLANKLILDALFQSGFKPTLVVASASIAGIRYRAGMLSYSLSKAALNALCGVYAKENPDVFFAVLGMCNILTDLSLGIISKDSLCKFPEHLKLRERFNMPGYAVSPEKRATEIYQRVIEHECIGITSGEFIELRNIL
ncbi:NAD(P)-dependent dehydrogenase (short-subunit alcohol dehydrogenase family) [Rahnella inusitata]|nr:NAD(P)-dependent dehydrogenase (short-subunit alcohol dehydrogenase family) [Rahnella inusitata]